MRKKTMKRFRILCALLVLLMIFASVFAVAACSDEESASDEVTVSKIEVTKLPTKTEYITGEEFSVDGGEITVTYSDGTSEIKKMTDSGVEITAPDTDAVDESDPEKEEADKNVIVEYGNKRTTFKISVSVKKFTVTFVYNYDDKTEEVSVIENRPVTAPDMGEREGYTFDKWCTDQGLTLAYDFSKAVTSDMTLYANWLVDAVYYDFTFHYNNIGSDPEYVTNKVKEGDVSVRIGEDPEREGYEFDGWFTAAEGGEEFAFGQPVTADTTVYAHWTRVQPMEEKDYVFEAEDLNLKGVKGPGASGQASGKSMIINKTGRGASGDRFVSYLYASGVTLTFELVSDMDTSASFAMSLSAEMRDFTMNPDNYRIVINGEDVDYSSISFKNVPKPTTEGSDCLQFRTYAIGNNIPLKKGVNTIKFITNNTDAMDGTTMTAMAPLVDCLKVTTDAVLTWNNSLGYPADNY